MTRITTFSALICGALVLAACDTETDPLSEPAPKTLPVTHQVKAGVKPMECKPRAWQKLIGKPATDARIPANLAHRVLVRDSVVTHDYEEHRLNIVTDVNGRVVDVSCG